MLHKFVQLRRVEVLADLVQGVAKAPDEEDVSVAYSLKFVVTYPVACMFISGKGQ